MLSTRINSGFEPKGMSNEYPLCCGNAQYADIAGKRTDRMKSYRPIDSLHPKKRAVNSAIFCDYRPEMIQLRKPIRWQGRVKCVQPPPK